MIHHQRSSFISMHHLRTYVSLFLIIHPHASSIIFIITHHASSITTYVRTYVRIHHHSSCIIHHYSSSFIYVRTYARTYHSSPFRIIHHSSLCHHYSPWCITTIHHHPSFITFHHHHHSSLFIVRYVHPGSPCCAAARRCPWSLKGRVTWSRWRVRTYIRKFKSNRGLGSGVWRTAALPYCKCPGCI